MYLKGTFGRVLPLEKNITEITFKLYFSIEVLLVSLIFLLSKHVFSPLLFFLPIVTFVFKPLIIYCLDWNTNLIIYGPAQELRVLILCDKISLNFGLVTQGSSAHSHSLTFSCFITCSTSAPFGELLYHYFASPKLSISFNACLCYSVYLKCTTTPI